MIAAAAITHHAPQAEPLSEPEAPQAEPEAAPEAAAIVITLPEGMRELALDRQTLNLWLMLAQLMYEKRERTDMTEALTEAFKVFLKVAYHVLKRFPIPGWAPLPKRERSADIIPFLLRYVAEEGYGAIARRYPSINLGEVMAAQAAVVALLGAQGVGQGVNGHGSTDAGLLAGLDAAAVVAASESLPGSEDGAQRAGSGAGRSDAGGSQPSERKRRRALGLRWRERERRG